MKRIKIYMMMLVAALMCGCSDDAPETTTDGLKLEIEVSNITNQTATLTGKVVEGPQNRYTYAFIVSKESFKKYDASSSAQTLYPCDYGKYTLDLTGLEPETTYYVAFYAHNDTGQEAYTFSTFSTNDNNFLTIGIEDPTNQTAVLEGSVDALMEKYYSYSFVVSKSPFTKYDPNQPNQTLYIYGFNDGSNNFFKKDGRYVLILNELDPNTIYYAAFRAYTEKGDEIMAFANFKTTNVNPLKVEFSDVTGNSAKLTASVDYPTSSSIHYMYQIKEEAFEPWHGTIGKYTDTSNHSVSFDISSLTGEKTYYIRVYVTIDNKIKIYSDQYSFTTKYSFAEHITDNVWTDEAASPTIFDFVNTGSGIKCHVSKYSDNYSETERIANTSVTVSDTQISSSSSSYSFNLESSTKDTMTLMFNGKRYNLKRKDIKFSDYAKFVDLGLPSGTKWLDRDLGAIGVCDYSWEYKWGSVEPYISSSGSQPSNLQGTLYDAAYVFNNNWCTPTDQDFDELEKNCTITLNSNFTIATITGPNRKKIYFVCNWYYMRANSSYSSYYFNKDGLKSYNSWTTSDYRHIRPVMK